MLDQTEFAREIESGKVVDCGTHHHIANRLNLLQLCKHLRMLDEQKKRSLVSRKKDKKKKKKTRKLVLSHSCASS